MAEKTVPAPSRSGGMIALMLVTAGCLVLAGRALPVVGDALALVLGIELLAWARLAREDGPLVAGGVVAGIGVGVLLAAWPLRSAAAHVVGGAFLLSIAGGLLLIAMLATPLVRRPQPWAWIAGPALAVVGAALVAGPDTLADVLPWALPTALLAAGVVVGLRWARTTRR